jgi:hypothetical protein
LTASPVRSELAAHVWLKDGFVTTAAANTIHGFADLAYTRVWIFLQKRMGTHQLPWRAEAALDCA